MFFLGRLFVIFQGRAVVGFREGMAGKWLQSLFFQSVHAISILFHPLADV